MSIYLTTLVDYTENLNPNTSLVEQWICRQVTVHIPWGQRISWAVDRCRLSFWWRFLMTVFLFDLWHWFNSPAIYWQFPLFSTSAIFYQLIPCRPRIDRNLWNQHTRNINNPCSVLYLNSTWSSSSCTSVEDRTTSAVFLNACLPRGHFPLQATTLPVAFKCHRPLCCSTRCTSIHTFT